MDIRDDEDVSVLGPVDTEPAREPIPVPPGSVHRLIAPNGEAAEALAAILRNHGYDATVADDADDAGARRVEARRQEAGDGDAVDDRALVAELAAEHGAEYEEPQTSAA